MNQHFISQFLIKNWLQEGTNYLNLFDIRKNTFIDKQSDNPVSTKGVFSSNQITKHNKILNELAEEIINKSKIETDAEEIITAILTGNVPTQIEINRLGKYFQLFSLLSSSYYWGDCKVNEDKLNQYVDDITCLNNRNTNILIMEKKPCDEDIVLTMNAFLCRYGNVAIYTVSPNIIIALGDELTNCKVWLSSNKLDIFNSDLAKIEFASDDNINLFPYIVFRNNSYESIRKLLRKPQQGLKAVIRIDEEQMSQAKEQCVKWNKGEYLLLLGERDKKNPKKLTPFSKYF